MKLFVTTRLVAALVIVLASTSIAFAQDDDAALKPAEPDFTLVALPTDAAAPEIQERVSRDAPVPAPARRGRLRRSGSAISSASTTARRSASSIASASSEGARSAFHRTERQDDRVLRPVRAAAAGRPIAARDRGLAAIDGTNNFKDSYSPAVGVLLSRSSATRRVLRRADLGQQHAIPCPRNSSTTTTRSSSASARAFASGRRSTRWRNRAAAAGYKPGVNMPASPSRSAPAVTSSS